MDGAPPGLPAAMAPAAGAAPGPPASSPVATVSSMGSAVSGAPSSLFGGAPGPSGDGDRGWSVVAMLTCSMVGSSLLSLPYFYGQAGLVAGLAWTALAYGASLLSLRLLLAATRDSRTRSYPMLGQFAHGDWGARAVDAAVVVFQFGTTVAATLGHARGPSPRVPAYITILVELAALLVGHRVPSTLFHAGVLVILVPAAFANPDPKVLAPVSQASVVLYLVMCVFLVLVAIASAFVDPASVPCAPSAAGFAQAAQPWPLVQFSVPVVLRALPIICQAFVCQGDLMSLHDAGSGLSPKHLYAAVRTALQLSTAIYVVFGVSGLTIMGPRHSETVWLCLHPYAPAVVALLEAAMALSLLLTFPMTFGPCRDSADDFLFARRSSIGHYQQGGHTGRPGLLARRREIETLAILALAYATAVKVPTVETVIAMTGAVAGFGLAFTLPAAFWLRLRHKPDDRSRSIVRAALILSVALAVACTACLVLADTEVARPDSAAAAADASRPGHAAPPAAAAAAAAAVATSVTIAAVATGQGAG